MLAELSARELDEWKARAELYGEYHAAVRSGMNADLAFRTVFGPPKE